MVDFRRPGHIYDTNNCFVFTGSDGIDPVFGQVVDIYVTGFAKTVLNGTLSISRNTVLKYCTNCFPYATL